MLDTLITSKTRIKLLVKFFLNPENKSYLRGLSEEFGESTNSIRVELNRFEEAGMLDSEMDGNKKIFKANPRFPLYNELQGIVKKFIGVDQIVERIAQRLGNLEEVYLMGELAEGRASDTIEILLIGKGLEQHYLSQLVDKTEAILNKSIKTQIQENKKDIFDGHPPLLIWKKL